MYENLDLSHTDQEIRRRSHYWDRRDTGSSMLILRYTLKERKEVRRPHSRFDDVTNVAVSERKDVTESLSHTWDRRCFPSGIVWTRMPRKLEPHHKQSRCKENKRLMGNGAIENTERDDADFLSKRTNRVDGLATVRYWKIVLFWNEFSAAGSSWRTNLPF